MASYTTNLNLKKPAGSENVSIGDINGNMDTIDTAFGAVLSSVSSKQISKNAATSHSLTVANNSRHLVFISGATTSRCWLGIVVCTGDGTVTYAEIYKATQSIFSSIDVSIANTIKFNLSGSYVIYVSDFYIGNALS